MSIKLIQFSVHVICGRHSDGSAICYVFPFFVVDVKLSHNKANGPESKKTHMFCSVRQGPEHAVSNYLNC